MKMRLRTIAAVAALLGMSLAATAQAQTPLPKTGPQLTLTWLGSLTLSPTTVVQGSDVTGTVVIENVFARQGLGTLLVEAVLTKDQPLVQALVVYTTAAYVIVNLVVDMLGFGIMKRL